MRDVGANPLHGDGRCAGVRVAGGAAVSDTESVAVLAERLDNHLKECAEQNEAMLTEMRQMRADLQPIINVYTTATIGTKFLRGLLQFVIYVGGAVGVIAGGLKALSMLKGGGA